MKHKFYLPFLFVLLISHIANAADEGTNASEKEKPLIIKGLSIGMDGKDARTIMEQILGKDWSVTDIGQAQKVCSNYNQGDSEVFFKDSSPIQSPGFFPNPILPGKYGFAVKDKKDYYAGFITIDDKTNKVIGISLGKKLTDYIFHSTDVAADDFVEQFRVNYNMPSFYWIPSGWQHKSPYGYTVKIMTSKFIDIKYEKKVEFN